ncbi:hypothetical protein LTR10_002871 [Elasticomyces elasticus]|nr:hypothetical protein LTR10_002871 [Elasticomyces elasticus]KAK4967790.1 hypothetical protein LTR42_010117 [Elasticomyces elasticus]
MDKTQQEYIKSLKVGHVRPSEVPWRRLGQYLYRVLEDGSQTQMRLCMIESLIPPHSDGPVFHWHEMHDEGFIVTKGKIRFHVLGGQTIDAQAGDIITVPIRLPHKFSNPFDEDGVFINTITPGFFVRYFEHLEALIGEGKVLTPEVNMAALKRFATIPVDEAAINQLIAESKANDSGVEIDL